MLSMQVNFADLNAKTYRLTGAMLLNGAFRRSTLSCY